MIIFASFSCPCEIIWSYLGESLLKERFRLCWPYSTLSTPGQVLHHLVQILCQIIGKKIFAYVFVWKNRTYLIQSDHYYVIWTKTRGKRRCIYRAFLACKMNAASLVPSLCELFWCLIAWLASASFLTDTSAPWFTGDKSEYLRFLSQRRVCPN